VLRKNDSQSGNFIAYMESIDRYFDHQMFDSGHGYVQEEYAMKTKEMEKRYP